MNTEYREKFLTELKVKLLGVVELIDSCDIDDIAGIGLFGEDNDLIFEKDLARYLGVDPKTLYRLRIDGLVSYTRVGKFIKYKMCDVKDILDGGYVKKTTATIEEIKIQHKKDVTKRRYIATNK